jgi:hypothetical protein
VFIAATRPPPPPNSLNVKAYGAQGDGVTDDRVAFEDVIAAHVSTGRPIFIPEGTYLLGRDASNSWSVTFDQLENITIIGVKGRSIIKHPAGMPNSSVALLRFNGCKHITIRDVTFDGGWGNSVTEITWASNGDVLPQATINVRDTSRFETAGSAEVDVGGGVTDTISWTGKTSETLTGCTGGTGTLRTGARLGILDGTTGINHTTQADPRNYLLMLRGCEDVEVDGCHFNDCYGDMVWLGFRGPSVEDGNIPCRNIRLKGCVGNVSARHGVAVGQQTDGLSVVDCEFRYINGTAFEMEPQGTGQFARDMHVDGGYFGLWWNPSGTGRFLSQSISVVGAGAAAGLIDGDGARSITIENATIEGNLGIWGARNVTVFNNTFITDFDHGATNGSYAPVYIDHVSDGIDILHNNFYDRGKYDPDDITDPEDDPHLAAIVVKSYVDLRPAGIRIAGNKIKVRNGRAGISVCGSGGQIGGTQEYTAATITDTTVIVTAAGWTVNEHIGKVVHRSGLAALVAGNTSDTLTTSGWFRPSGSGNIEVTPSAGAFRLIAVAGVVTVENNDIDCIDDGNGAGGVGIHTTASNVGGALRIRNNNIRGATGYGVEALLGSFSTLFELVGNHVYDDQETQTTTTAFYVSGVEDAVQTVIYGNTSGTGLTHMGGLTAGSWRTSDGWAGFDDPNGLIYDTAGKMYVRQNSSSIYMKQSPVTAATGWQPILTVPRATLRGIGTAAYGAGALTPGLPPSIDGDIEVLVCQNHDASPVVLTTPSRFEELITGESVYAFATNTAAIYWRRFRVGDVAPVVADPGSDFNSAKIYSFKDCINYGNPFSDYAVVENDGVGSAPAFPGGTSLQANSLILDIITWFSGGGGGTPGNIDSWANAAVAEVEEVDDNRYGVVSDVFGQALCTSRDIVQGAFTGATAQLYDSYNVWCAFTLVLIPAEVLARSSGTITCTTKANYANTPDSDYMTIGDGIVPPVRYEFDVAGDGDADGVVVNISGATTAADVAAILRTAILANQPSLGVVDNADGTLTVTHQWPGAGGNVTMTENVTNGGHTVSGLTGGQG